MVVILAVLLVVYTPLSAVTSEKCADHGFPSAKVEWNLERYCVTEVDETEYVVPVDEAQAWSPPRHYRDQ